MESIIGIFQTQNLTFQQFAQKNPAYLWLNVLSEATFVAAYLATAIAAIYFLRTKDRAVRRVSVVPIAFLLLSAATRSTVLLASWISMFPLLVTIKALNAAFCAAGAIIFIPNMRRFMRLHILEASHETRIELEKQIELRNKSEQMLRLYEEMVTNSSQAVLAFCLKRNRILYANQEFERQSGYLASELIGQPFDLLRLPEEEHVLVVEQMEKALDQSGVWRAEMKPYRKDRSRFWCEIAIKRLHHPEFGEILVSLTTDITARKAAEEKILLQQAQIATSAKMAALGEMAAGIGHEINNPLASIQANVEDIKDLVESGQITNDQIVARLSKIEKTGERIAKIIKGLRTFAREESEGERRKQSLRDIVLETLELCSERIRQNGVSLRVPDIEPSIYIDCLPGQISQVLLNLLNNSFDAVADLENRWIEIRVTRESANIEVIITDSGGGIAMPIRSRIMEPFFTTKEPGRGSGLGLSISQGIIESHRGTLELNCSEPNTQFVIRLPQSV